MTGAQHDHFPPETPTAWQRLTAHEKYALVKHALHADHMSYGEAATALGASRVAIAGVVERSKRNPLGPIVSSIRPPTKGVKPKPRKKHAGFNKFVALPFIAPVAVEPAPDAVWLPLPGVTPVTIEHHREDQCRWIHGGEPGHPWLYCSEPVIKGTGVYCSRHAAVAYRELPTKTARKETSA